MLTEELRLSALMELKGNNRVWGFDSAVSRSDSSPNLARRAAGGLVSGGTAIISLCLRMDGRAGWIFAGKCKLRYRVGCLSNVSRRDTRFVSGRVSY
ncbi:Queuine tRNA-ribosyltransferase catalytic subunit [Fusarium oxysporum f. sp. albedinis]|nr:Queuine tRNA-ribosyltransferase catalytic subunit [Fusarium oxysporum f. sp. albedinis]